MECGGKRSATPLWNTLATSEHDDPRTRTITFAFFAAPRTPTLLFPVGDDVRSLQLGGKDTRTPAQSEIDLL